MMKKCYTVFLLCFLPVLNVSAEAYLPDSLDGQIFLFQVDSENSSQNPNAGFIYFMSFSQQTYRYQIIGTRTVVTGNYAYEHIKGADHVEVGLLNNSEVFEGVDTHYQMVLMPKDNTAGLYLFKQIAGPVKPRVRMNSARYTRLL